ncbi:MAG: Do family serine endopeptidase [Rhodocyclaceae bacterium]|nr:Do family serine endopeptidase [Rhodocyclaceae bacterium]
MRYAVLLCLWLLALPSFASSLPDFTELAEKQGPAVVNISTVARGGPAAPFAPNMDEDDPMFEFFHRFFPRPPGAPREFENKSLGSGFIISGDGYILTNAHVVEGAEEILVRLTDKRELKARLIGADKRTDVALIKIEAQKLPKVTLGDPGKLKVGEWVIAIGSPFGFENSVTAGIVSAKGRELPQENLVPFIQTDVAINPGNSGGPLFNMKGQVVGINSQIYSRSGGYMGLSFSIPIDVAMEVQAQLKNAGRVSRGRIGVIIQEVSKDLADSFGLPEAAGALVASVERGGPSERAGIQTGDIITRFDGRPVRSSADLPRIVTATRPGARVTVQVWRKGGSRDLTVTVAELADDTARAARQPAAAPDPAANRLGLVLREVPRDKRREFGISGGLQVEGSRDGSFRGELRAGDILLAVISKGSSTELKTVEQFNRLLVSLPRGANLTLLVRRGDTQTFVAIRIPGDK